MPADASDVLVLAEPLQIVMAHEDVFGVLDLKGGVMGSGRRVANDEDHVMIDRLIATVQAREHAESVIRRAAVDFVGRNQPECLVIPIEGLIHSGRSQNAVADTSDARRPAANTDSVATPDALA